MLDASFDVVAHKYQVDGDLLVGSLRVFEDNAAESQLLIHGNFPPTPDP
jgi:hypothetical protein